MAIKDYKSQVFATHPQIKKDHKAKHAFKKTTITFVVGFVLGALTASGVFIEYFADNDTAIYAEQAEPTTPPANKQPESSQDSAIAKAIDYQFYETLRDFELPAPVADTFPADDADEAPFLNQPNQATLPDQRSELAAQSKNKDANSALYILQAGTFTDASKAQTQRRKIIDLGYKNTHISQLSYDHQQYYRVWLGPYNELAKATTVGNMLKRTHIEVMLRPNLRDFNPSEKPPG